MALLATHASRLHLFLFIHFLSLQDSWAGQVSLIVASRNGYPAIVILLLAAGANVDKQSDDGYTPLIYAAYWGKIEVVKELLKAGANKKLTNKYGKTAYDYASKEEIEALLR